MFTKKLMLGGSVETSPVALGCMRMAGIGVERAELIVRLALERGITLFDHADIYGGGESETLFGEVLRKCPSLRGQMQIQDKCGICKGYYDASKQYILSAVDGSLKRLGVEQLDFLLLHRPDALLEPEEVADAFDTLARAGKVRYFGVSNQNAGQLALLQKSVKQKLMIDQLQFGLAHTPLVDEGINVNIHSQYAASKTGGTLDYCRLNDITLQAWSPFQHGMFEGAFISSDRYESLNQILRDMAAEKQTSVMSIAIAWILRHPAHIQPIVGTMNERHLLEICEAGQVELTRQEWYRLYLAAGNPLP